MGVTITIDVNADAALTALQNMIDSFHEKVASGLDQAGQEIVAYAQQIVKVRTGHLRSTIHYIVDPAAMTLTLIADATYAGYVEFGTRRMAARPYMRPAIDAYWQMLQESVSQAVAGL